MASEYRGIFTVHIALTAVVMMTGTLAVLAYAMRSSDVELAVTIAFTTFILFELFNALNARTENGTAFHRRFFDTGCCGNLAARRCRQS